MKAITAITGASVPAISNGRVARHRDGENAEIQMYLSKLKDLVPFMPKNRKLSKLEVILNVIDYICDLQTALESHPAVNQFDAESVLSGLQQQQQQLQQQMNQTVGLNRQPLGLRASPNMILNSTNNQSSSNHTSSTHHHSIHHLSSDNITSTSLTTTTSPTTATNKIVNRNC